MLSFARELLLALVVTQLASSQAVPGASFFGGGGSPGAAAYQLIDDYQPSTFFNKFQFYSSYDPTYGHVQYVNKTVAVQNGYVSVTNQSSVKIGADTTNKWPRGGPGRPSVRIISSNTYTHGLFILDLTHMPWGCGTWPAYWLLGPNWPSNGEIDIIEGVNTQTTNGVSLHASPNCTIAGADQSGTLQTTNCDTSVNYNSGCGTQMSNTSTPYNYGKDLNDHGGGVYATEWTSNFIKTWYFPRGSIPASITTGNPDVSTFGQPAVNQQGSCVFDQHFNNHSIIINLDFCGAWAGEVYGQFPECPQTPNVRSLDSCVDYVGNNPQNFTNAYWDIKSLRVYQMPAGAVASTSYSTSYSSISVTSSNTVNKGMGTSTSVSSSQYTGPLSSATTSAVAPTSTPLICPQYNNTVYVDYNQQGYNIECGFDYNGGSGAIAGGGIIQTLSFELCLEACDNTTSCLGAVYVGGNGAGNCYLKAVPGSLVYNGAVNAALRVNGPVMTVGTATVSSSTATVSVAAAAATVPPICPDAGGKPFTDSGGVVYAIACYLDFPGGNIGTPMSFDTFAACLPSCDVMSGCLGATYNYATKQCQLKSSFTGTQSSNNQMVAARKNVMASSSRSSSSSVSTRTSSSIYGYGGNGYGGYGDGGYGSPSSSTSSSLSFTIRSSSSVISSSMSMSSSSRSSSMSLSSTSTSSSVQSSSPVLSSVTSNRVPISSVPPMVSTAPTSTFLSSLVQSSLSSTTATSSSLSRTTSSSTTGGTMSSSLSSSAPMMPSSTTSQGVPPSASSPQSSMLQPPMSSMILSGSPTPVYSSSSSSTMSMSPASSLPVTLSPSGPASSLSTLMTDMPASSPASSSTIDQPTSSAAASVPPCPSTTDAYCGQTSQQQTTCSSDSGAVYSVTCGIMYYGSIIDTTDIVVRRELDQRATAQSIDACQDLCAQYPTCVALNYVGNNCALLDRVDGSMPNANAIAGRVVIAAAVSTSSSAIDTQGPPAYGSSTASEPNASSPASSGSAPAVTTTTYLSPPATITLTSTTTQQLPPGGSFVSGPSGSYYVYSSSAVPTNNSITLCYNCGLTPTVVVGPTPTPPPSNSTCPAKRIGTTTVYTTSTLTSCPPEPTCPASGYVIIGGSTTYPGQQIVTTTGKSGRPITYTQIPISRSYPVQTTATTQTPSTSSPGSGLSTQASGPASYLTATSSVIGPGPSAEPSCPVADNTIYTDTYGMRYLIHCDSEFSDITLDTQNQSTVSACLASCDLYNVKSFYLPTQCQGVSFYSDRNTSNCLLKAGSTRVYRRNCESCQLLTPSRYNSTSTVTVTYVSPSPYTTVVGGSTVVSTYTTTLPASTITIYSTIFTNGVSTGTPVGYSTISASTVTSTVTTTIGGTTVITQAPGGYYGGGGGTGNGGNQVTVTVTATNSGGRAGPGYSSGGGSPSTVYVVSTIVSTYVSNGQTIYSTYGVTTVANTVYLPGTTQTVTTTTTSIQVTRSIQYVPTTIVTTAQGATTTIVTQYPVTYTYVVTSGGGAQTPQTVTVTASGQGGNGGGTVTVTQGSVGSGQAGTVTVTQGSGAGGTITVTQGGSQGGTVTVTQGGGSGAGGGTVTLTQGGSQGGTVTVTRGGNSVITVTAGGGGSPSVITVTASGQGGGGSASVVTVTAAPQTVTATTGGGGGGGGGSNNTVTVTANEGGGTVVLTATVTKTALPSSTSSSFTCRTYATNYLNGLHGRAEPTSAPRQVNGVVMHDLLPVQGRIHKQSIFQKEVIMAEIDRLAKGPGNILTADFDYWFVE